MKFEVAVDVMPKQGISDPQGQAIERALPGLGLGAITQVRVGKRLMLEVEGESWAQVEALVSSACQKFLTNPIIEDHSIHLASSETAV